MIRKVVIVILAAIPLISMACSRTPERPATSGSERVSGDASVDTDMIAITNDCPGTVLVFVCDNPDDVGSVDRSYPAQIDWPGGSEEFSLTLSQEDDVVCLSSVVPRSAVVRIFFDVEEAPPCRTRFTVGEWFVRGRMRTVALSRFRNADRLARTVAPRSIE